MRVYFHLNLYFICGLVVCFLYTFFAVRVQMPICDGFVSTSLIRRMVGIVQPFISALTANAMEGDAEHCLQMGPLPVSIQCSRFDVQRSARQTAV
jgi:CheY-like chemotaxis protein